MNHHIQDIEAGIEAPIPAPYQTKQQKMVKRLAGATGLLIFVAAVAALVSSMSAPTEALVMENRRDCDYTDVVVNCGTLTTAELLSVYNNNIDGVDGRDRGNRDIQAIFKHFGITPADISSSTAKKGRLNTNGTITVNGVTVADNAKSMYRGHPGKQVDPLTIAGNPYFIGPVAGNYGLAADVFVFFNSDGTFKVAVQASCGNPITATNKVTPPAPKPTPVAKYSCDNLVVSKKISRTEFEFTATASATNAKIVSYNYNMSDGTKLTGVGNVIKHTFKTDTAKSYTVSATANVNVDGKTVATPIGKCAVTVDVEKKPADPKPAITITKKVNGKDSATVAQNTEFTYTIVVKNTGNVVLKNAVITDEAPSEVTLTRATAGTINKSKNTWKHTITELKVGAIETFAITALYPAYAANSHKNSVCVDTSTIPGSKDACDDATTKTTKDPMEVCDLTDNTVKTIERSTFNKETMTTDLSKCGTIKVCIIEDKTIVEVAKKDYNEATMTEDLSQCAEVPETPAELPQTGLGEWLAGGTGVAALAAAFYYYNVSQKNLKEKMLKK